jgi:hypothetical protein
MGFGVYAAREIRQARLFRIKGNLMHWKKVLEVAVSSRTIASGTARIIICTSGPWNAIAAEIYVGKP